MSLLESARVSTPSELSSAMPADDVQSLNANLSDAWAPRSEISSSGNQQISPEVAFLPFTRFAMADHVDFNPHQPLGLSRAWGYSRHDSVLNPDGGSCNASSTSMKCEAGPRQYRGANQDVPNLYDNQRQVNGGTITAQYFAPAGPQVKSPDNFRYLNDPAAENSLVVEPINYESQTASVRDAVNNRLESGLEKQRPIQWRENSLDAFVEAVENSKPMVVVFGDNSSPLFNKQIQEMRSDKDSLMSRLSERAVFVVGKPTEDEYARRMASHLKLTDYPTISVIAPRTDQLTETYRMEGYFKVADIYADLDKALPVKKEKPLADVTVA
ncbi:MAG TPA: hypothetical protein PKZ32_01565 [Candidatus Melainabacteria bacterium]|nr:hypothetical protein [Candidatus Melainabacteria bacterium]